MLARLFGKRDNETTGISIYDWAKMFRPGAQVLYNGRQYQAFTTTAPNTYEANSIVFACEANRLLLFSEARFQWQQLRNGRPGDLFGTPELALLEKPWPGASTRELLVQAELDVFSAGNSYWVNSAAGLIRLDPRKMTLLTAGVPDLTSGRIIGQQLIGYGYREKQGDMPVVFPPEEIAHYHPYPSNADRFCGTSWVSSCVSDVDADNALTEHKRSALSQGANVGYVVSLDPDIGPEDFEFFVDKFREDHDRPENSGKTLFLGGGADIKTVGQTFEQLAFKAVQGAGETRIAACAGVPPVVVGLSEGLQGSSLNAGNYGQARRRLSDGTMRPLWGSFVSAFQGMLTAPGGSRLWYDDRDIAWLREDVKDQAEIVQANAETITKLIREGYQADAAVDAVMAGDLTRLTGKHTGLVSVQLQPYTAAEAMGASPPDQPSVPPGKTPPALPAPAPNGNPPP